MAAPLILAGLTLLPKIPDMWNAVASLFGKKVPKTVVEATDLATGIMDAFKKGQVPPEVEVELVKEMNKHKETMAELSLKEKELEFSYEDLQVKDLHSLRELEKEAYRTGDEFVAHTRPLILRRMFWLCAIFCIIAPLSILVGSGLGLVATTMALLVETIKWIGGWIFSTFGISYLGYTGARMVDKKNPHYKDGNGTLNKLVNFATK